MADQESLLTDNEQRALAVHEDLPRARAIQAWMTYAALQNFDADRLVVGVEEIRNMSPKRLKRVRKDLVAATRLLDDMMAASYDMPIQAEQCIPGSEPVSELAVDALVSNEKTEAAPSVDEKPEALPHEASVSEVVTDQPDEVIAELVAESIETDSPTTLDPVLSEQGKVWVAKLIAGYEFGEKTIDEVARDIYVMMGEPKTRLVGGKKIDPLERITQRLMGESNTEIALRDEVSPSAVSQWFKSFVEKKFLNPKSSVETEQEPEIPHPTPLRIKQKRVEAGEPVPDGYKDMVTKCAVEAGLKTDEIEALHEVLDPSFSLEMSGTHRQVRHRFRLYLASKLPNLESDELGLTSNEIARLSRLLGREKQADGFSFTAAPQSAHEISMDHGYLVPQNRDELLRALYKAVNYILSEDDKAELGRTDSDICQQLLAAGFSQQEADALLGYITFDEEGKAGSRTPEAAEGLKRLQRILAQSRHKISDQEITAPGLTMLTNVAFGNKTINDVYYKAHGKDPQITRQQVSDRIIKGIEELIA